MDSVIVVTDPQIEQYVDSVILSVSTFRPEDKSLMVAKFRAYFNKFSKIYNPEEYELLFQKKIKEPTRVYLFEATEQIKYLDLCWCEISRVNLTEASRQNMITYIAEADGSIKIVRTERAEQQMKNTLQQSMDALFGMFDEFKKKQRSKKKKNSKEDPKQSDLPESDKDNPENPPEVI